jgi:hypothetical protein
VYASIDDEGAREESKQLGLRERRGRKGCEGGRRATGDGRRTDGCGARRGRRLLHLATGGEWENELGPRKRSGPAGGFMSENQV